jgi:hypothetical protein
MLVEIQKLSALIFPMYYAFSFQSNCFLSKYFMKKKLLTHFFIDSQVQTTDQEAAVNHQRHNTIIIDNRVEQEPCILMSSNSMEDTDSNTQTNIIHKSNTKGERRRLSNF